MSSSLRALLISRRDEIVARFMAEARRTDVAPPKVSGLLLADHVPRLIDEIIDELEAGERVRVSQEVVAVSETARRHGGQRWALGYELEAVVREYGILRHVVLDFARAAALSLTIDEYEVLSKCLSVGVAEAVAEYTRYHDGEVALQRWYLEFLSGATELLSSTLDHPATLARVVHLIVPQLADWCAIYVAGANIETMPIAHVSPGGAAMLREVFRRFPLVHESAFGYPAALERGQPTVVDSVQEGWFEASARSAEHLAALRALGARSWITVPLRVGPESPGAITLATGASGRRYGARELVLMQELARRAAIALDNARLYELSRSEHLRMEAATRAKDELVARVSHDLRTQLNVIVGWIRLIRSETLPEPRLSQAFEVIERSANALTRLTSELFDTGGAADAAPRAIELEREGAKRGISGTIRRNQFAVPPGLAGLRVLVVDEPDTRDLIRVVLESCGVEVRDAGRVRDALAVLENYRPDVIVSEIGMPEEDGYTLIRRVRSLPAEKAQIPAIALTAFASSNERTQALQAGFNLHLSKPVEPAALLAAVAELAGRTPGEQSQRRSS